jgi:ribonuclease-3
MDADLLARAQAVLEHEFQDRELLVNALTHSSVANTRLESNERLEFLGDAILSAVVCEELYRRFDEWYEGDLTKVKSAVVSRRICAKMADKMGLGELVVLGKGVAGRDAVPVSLRAAAFEAVVGAIFLDGGFDKAKAFILKHTAPHIDKSSKSEDQDNHKSTLQQHVQREMSATPRYETLDEQGPDHSKCFEICVVVGGRRFPSAWGPSKKAAEQEAAKRALEVLRSGQLKPNRDGKGHS